jgi:pyruvate/2-oxoglutarate dehydrogenase complex dihydrolipoamide dehydrogenase (E3) component
MSYDLIVIGGGTGGLTAARLVARQGKRVALVERGRPGGDCLWTGCIPTKALAHIAKLIHGAREGFRFGVTAGDLRLDYQAVRRHLAEAQRLAGRVDAPETIASWGVELIQGEARFLDPKSVETGGKVLRASSFVLATGSKPSIPGAPGLAEAGFDTNETLLDWEQLPSSLAILGGGPIGVEFAQIMARFGVEVTLIERLPRLLDREEPDASALVRSVLEREGVEVVTGANVSAVHGMPGGIRAEIQTGSGPRTVAVERLLVATGRRPALDSLNLPAAGIRTSPAGIEVDAHLRTSQPHIFAVGDINGSPQFTHVAEDQGRTVAGVLSRGRGRFRKPPRWSSRVVPRVTYTDPEVAAVGLTEDDARRQRRNVQAWTTPLSEIDRAITMGATDGFLKLITARGWQSRIPGLAGSVGDEIVGACFVGPNAGDLLMPVVMAMRARLPVGLVAWNMQAYPTLSLGVRQVAGLPFGG